MAQPRRMVVLRAIVEDYIRSQEPIGSAALTKKHDLGVSSATIRNDMASLEEEGYRHPAPHVLGPHPDGEGLPVLRGPPVHRRPPLRRAAQGNRGVPVRIRQPAGHVAARGQTAFPHNRSGGRGRLPVPGQGEGAARADRPRLIHVAADRGHHRRGNVAQHTLALSPQPTDITLADVGSS